MGALNIDMLGTSFSIKANEDDEYLEKLLGYFKQITQEIESSGGLKQPIQIAIMSALMLCDELYKEKTKTALLEENKTFAESQSILEAEDRAEVERLTMEMIEKIDKVLQ